VNRPPRKFGTASEPVLWVRLRHWEDTVFKRLIEYARSGRIRNPARGARRRRSLLSRPRLARVVFPYSSLEHQPVGGRTECGRCCWGGCWGAGPERLSDIDSVTSTTLDVGKSSTRVRDLYPRYGESIPVGRPGTVFIT